MNLGQLRQRLSIGVARDDLNSEYNSIIEQAHHDMQVSKSWSCMREVDTVTIPAGSLSVSMPDNFKELISDKTPIFTIQDGVVSPCTIRTPEQLDRLIAAWNTTVTPTTDNPRNIYIAVTEQDGLTMIRLPVAFQQDITFRVTYFGFLRKLAGDSDETPLTRDYPEVIINRAKSIAFGLINDPAEVKAEARYDLEFKKAARNDAHKVFAGRDRRM